MGARIELVKGNVFDGSADLVVIPCSTRRSITWFVAEHLSSFGIPEPQKPMKLGGKRLMRLAGISTSSPSPPGPRPA
jgi:hypothetical protein